MDKVSEALYRLKPVTYRYKKEIDRTQNLAFGLIAEEVAEANPDLVANNAQGQPEGVHYEMVNAMLLNEFLKQHRKIQEQAATVMRLRNDFQSKLTKQERQIKALVSGMEKLNAQLQISNAATRTALND